MTTTVENKVYHCESCDYTTLSACYYERHLNGKWHKEGKGSMFIYSCKICDYKSNSKSNYARHINGKPHTEKKKGVEKAKLNSFYCDSCMYGTSDKSNYDRHLKCAKHKSRTNIFVTYDNLQCISRY